MPITSGAGPLANAETGIVKAMRIDRREPLVALGECISAAETALGQFKCSPHDETARKTYNFAVGRIIVTIRDAKLDPWTQPLRVPRSNGEFVLTHKPNQGALRFYASGSVRCPWDLRHRARYAWWYWSRPRSNASMNRQISKRTQLLSPSAKIGSDSLNIDNFFQEAL